MEGQESHVGKYTSFSHELPSDVHRETNKLTVWIAGSLDAAIPRGNQESHVYRWGGIWYQTYTGSIRSVWLEPVERNRLAFNDYYYAEWRWNPSRGVYSRWMQGEPHIERNTGAQVTATAVIVRVHQVGRVAGDDKARESIQVYGSGKAYIMQDGRITRATWRKDDVKSPTLYYDAQGNQIRFNRGGIWIQVIPQYGSASFR